MTRHSRTLTIVAAWFAMLAVGCAPPVSRAADDVETDLKEKAGRTSQPAAPSVEPETNAWGTISGKFKFIGGAPKMKQYKPAKDVEVCGATEPLFEESLIVGDSGEFANVVVYAMPSSDKWDEAISPIHPELVKRENTEAVLQAENCRFEPHVLAGWTEQVFWFRNKDSRIGHNMVWQGWRNRVLGQTIPATADYKLDLYKAEKLPFPATCSIHPWMKAYILVRPDPYFAVSAKDGSFRIENLPARKFAFQFWHESLGYLKTITIDGKKLADDKGVHSLTVEEGGNDLGVIEIAATDYAKQLEKFK